MPRKPLGLPSLGIDYEQITERNCCSRSVWVQLVLNLLQARDQNEKPKTEKQKSKPNLPRPI
jgi:hypothetical protein